MKSVHADAKSVEIDAILIALGLIFYTVTGPFWNLLRSDVQYLDLYSYVTTMAEKFEMFAEDSSPVLSCSSIFPEFSVAEKEVIHPFKSLQESLDLTVLTGVQGILQKLFGGFLHVVKRQLVDFLPDGKYFAIEDPQLRQNMAHCKLTNLIGEACLGDLDYSLFKRRNSSLHHHSTMNMLKRNKTMSGWFAKKSDEEQRHLLKLSTKKGQELRDKHQQDERDVIAKKRAQLERNKAIEEDKKVKAQERKDSIVQILERNGGVCKTDSDVDELLTKFVRLGAKREAIINQIQYYKVVLGISHPLLKTTGFTLDGLIGSLKTFIGNRQTTSNIVQPAGDDRQPTTDVGSPEVVVQSNSDVRSLDEISASVGKLQNSGE